MTPPTPGSYVADDTALSAAWAALMGEGGFTRRSVWLLFLDPDDRMLPTLMPVDDLPRDPDALFVTNLASIIDGLVRGNVGSVAMLLSRHGTSAMHDGDRCWAAAIAAALRPGLRRWPMHLATADRIQVFAPDDLVATAGRG